MQLCAKYRQGGIALVHHECTCTTKQCVILFVKFWGSIAVIYDRGATTDLTIQPDKNVLHLLIRHSLTSLLPSQRLIPALSSQRLASVPGSPYASYPTPHPLTTPTNNLLSQARLLSQLQKFPTEKARKRTLHIIWGDHQNDSMLLNRKATGSKEA